MKKILIASTALVLVAGSAMADVKISGYGRYGLKYDDAWAKKTQIDMRMRLNIDASMTTDGGVTFGGRIRLQYDENRTSAVTNQADFYAKVGGLKVDVGNVSDAIDAMSTIWNSEVGFLATSSGDPLISFIGYTTGPSPVGQVGILVTYSTGPVTARVSYYVADQTVSGSAHETAVSVDYKAGNLALGLGYVNNGAFSGNDDYILSAEYSMGNYTIGGIYQDGDSLSKALFTLYGSTTMGATTVSGYLASGGWSGADTAVGVGVAYDLGGATLSGSIQHNLGGDNWADVGVKFNF